MQTKLLILASTLVSTVAAAPLGCGSLDGHTGTPGTLARRSARATALRESVWAPSLRPGNSSGPCGRALRQ
jgi:hypothetical protein